MTLATGMEVLGGAPVFAETKKDDNISLKLNLLYKPCCPEYGSWMVLAPTV